jgi:hypothetical protein
LKDSQIFSYAGENSVKFEKKTHLRRKEQPLKPCNSSCEQIRGGKLVQKGQGEREIEERIFSRQILNTGPTAVGSARSCTTVSRVERTGVFFYLRNPDVILTVRSRDTWRDPIPSQNRESGVGGAKESSLSQNPETITAVHLTGQVAADYPIGISAVRGFKLSKKLDIATREIAIREIPIRSQPSILAGHVADIEATIGIRRFLLTDTLCQRSIASRDIPRRHQDRPSLSDTWRNSGDSEKFPKRKAPSANRDSGHRET